MCSAQRIVALFAGQKNNGESRRIVWIVRRPKKKEKKVLKPFFAKRIVGLLFAGQKKKKTKSSQTIFCSADRWTVFLAHICSNRAEQFLENREEQIIETRDKPQYLDIQRYLSYLQYPDETKSSTKDLSLPPFNLKSSW